MASAITRPLIASAFGLLSGGCGVPLCPFGIRYGPFGSRAMHISTEYPAHGGEDDRLVGAEYVGVAMPVGLFDIRIIDEFARR
jgi:hypothetical protein